MKDQPDRRDFLKTSVLATAGLGLTGALRTVTAKLQTEPLFKISLAEWSVNRKIFSGELDHLDFPKLAREAGINAVEYVNQFFMDKAQDRAYLREMKLRADGEGVRSVLIMCDREGLIGHPEEAQRLDAVEKHKKWVEAAKYLGCHAIRINGFSSGSFGSVPGDFEEEQRLVADGLHRLCVFAADFDISIIIENHGGHSSHGTWLAGVIERADHPGAGTLPDFGNFRITEGWTYDSYRGVEELMPYAKGVSVKPRVYDDNGNQSDLDYLRMMRIVLNAGYHSYCGIEHGPAGSELEGIQNVHEQLKMARDHLSAEL